MPKAASPKAKVTTRPKRAAAAPVSKKLVSKVVFPLFKKEEEVAPTAPRKSFNELVKEWASNSNLWNQIRFIEWDGKDYDPSCPVLGTTVGINNLENSFFATPAMPSPVPSLSIFKIEDVEEGATTKIPTQPIDEDSEVTLCVQNGSIKKKVYRPISDTWTMQKQNNTMLCWTFRIIDVTDPDSPKAVY